MEKSAISKAECRQRVIKERKDLKQEDAKQWDSAIAKQILSFPQLQKEQNDTVYCYMGVRGETGTREMIEIFLSQGYRVAVPRVKGKTMAFYYIKSFADLEPGVLNIPEPVAACEKAACKTAPVIVPGVAFSKKFERTGYGAGYYDKFFEEEPGHEKIAVCYDFQIFETLTVDEFDVPMDYIVTQSGILCNNKR